MNIMEQKAADIIKNKNSGKKTMNIVVVGHVDHGKSTVIGRLLADTGSLPKGKLEYVKENCLRNSKPFEYAFLIDALKDEQSQGITIDSARVFFSTEKRNYMIMDAPGHIEFLKNMVTGASHAEAALLVIDAAEGVQENSRRHGYMLSMLGIRQLVVLINKMDLVSYERSVFESIVKEYSDFLSQLGLSPSCFIPVSAACGDVIAVLSKNMPWYKGKTVLEVLDSFKKEKDTAAQAFRMPVQDVYKFTKSGDNRRIIAGTIETGSIKAGDDIVFYPSGKKNQVRSIELFNAPPASEMSSGYAVGLTIKEQIYVTRGEVIVKEGEPKPAISSRLKVSLFWLGKGPMLKDKEYILKTGTARVFAVIESIDRIIDASTLASSKGARNIKRHDVAECVLRLNKAIPCDVVGDTASMSRFVIVDKYKISGGGIIREALDDDKAWIRDKVFIRNYKWEKSIISSQQRAEKYKQKAALLLFTGQKSADKKTVAKELEAKLFAEGRLVYFLGIGNVLYGVDADIERKDNNRNEHMRRLAEVVHILLDAGVIVIVTATDLGQEDLEVIKMTVNSDMIETFWVGKDVTTDIAYDLLLCEDEDSKTVLNKIEEALRNKGIIPRPS